MRLNIYRYSSAKVRTRSLTLVVLTSSILAIANLSTPGYAQEGTAIAVDTKALPNPVATGVLGTKASGALSEIQAHVRAVASSSWKDLKGTGTVTYPRGDTHNATLYLSGAGNTRFDIVMTSGTRSVRLKNHLGQFEDEKGYRGTFLSGTSAAGIVAFPRVWTIDAESPQVSISDQGAVVVNGQSLHRIAIEYPWDAATYKQGDPTVATDLYFDPTNRLLVFSVDSVSFVNNPSHLFKRVTSYGGYKSFDGVLIPTTIEQSLDGQASWKLQMDSIILNSEPPLNTFSF